MSETGSPRGFSTTAVWGGEDEPVALGSSQPPIFHTAPFSYPDMSSWYAAAEGRAPGYIYSRISNPTVAVFEEKLKALEGAGAAAGFASGMAAISNTLFALLSPGDRLVSVRDTYGGTSKMFLDFLPRMDVDVTLVETGNDEALEQAIATGCKIVYLETPTNPTLKILDLERAIRAARKVAAIVVVDNTFATPLGQRPLAQGADLSLHSATKFLGGHDDALGGVIAGNARLVDEIRRFRDVTGACLSPFAAYLLLRGMKTLELRFRRQNETAMAIALRLSEHDGIERVFYPGLSAHPGHSVARSQMTGFGGVLSFAVKGGVEAAERVIDNLSVAQRAASLGCVTTLVGVPATTSHIECSAEERAQLGIPEGLVRYSCGIENAEDLLSDLEQALDAAGSGNRDTPSQRRHRAAR